ncbi:hypothetical protein [Actinoplanes sp. DH11]|uniref:hypothetical protein n=1 Tax=Actinoplanes sp. DH11 TaxID=2857011 RepID=UPI001E4F4DF0|nr:hypothetical protein [Actinoplanes sp. DH11]
MINYRTGMRASETLALRRGCRAHPPDGLAVLHGQASKTSRHHAGHTPAPVRDTPWVAIGPVVTAIRVLERMTDGSDLLFDVRAHSLHGHSRQGALTIATMRDRLDAFHAWINTLAAQLDLPGEAVPPDPLGPITVRRFRRTLAWHIDRRPGELVALAVQYGHLRTAVSAGRLPQPRRHPRPARHRNRTRHRRHPRSTT